MKNLRRYALSKYGLSILMYAALSAPFLIVDFAAAQRLNVWLDGWLPDWASVGLLISVSVVGTLAFLILSQWQTRWIVRDARHD